MSKIYNISSVIEDKRNKRNKKRVDVEAAYAVLDQCLAFLEMNPLEEVRSLKNDIKNKMKELKEIGKEWHQTT